MIMFIEVEVRMMIYGKHKENVSKHDFIYGSAKMSIDMMLSALVLLVALFILYLVINGGEADDDLDNGDCLCCDASCMSALCGQSHYHCDCVCGVNNRSQF